MKTLSIISKLSTFSTMRFLGFNALAGTIFLFSSSLPAAAQNLNGWTYLEKRAARNQLYDLRATRDSEGDRYF